MALLIQSDIILMGFGGGITAYFGIWNMDQKYLMQMVCSIIINIQLNGKKIWQ